MAGDSMRKVQGGDSLVIPAQTWNRILGVVQKFEAQMNMMAGMKWGSRQGTLAPVKNDSGADRDQFDVLGIDEPIVLPSENLESFDEQLSLVGVLPSVGGTSDDHTGRFVILLEAIPEGEIGLACIAGVCQVDVYVNDADDTNAEIDDGQAAYLTSDTTGSAVILWKQAGTGLRPAVVRIGGGGGGGGVGPHALLDGGTVHTDTELDTPELGALVVGRQAGTDAATWDKLQVGDDGRIPYANEDAAGDKGIAWSAGTRVARKGFYLNSDNEVIVDWLRIHA